VRKDFVGDLKIDQLGFFLAIGKFLFARYIRNFAQFLLEGNRIMNLPEKDKNFNFLRI